MTSVGFAIGYRLSIMAKLITSSESEAELIKDLSKYFENLLNVKINSNESFPERASQERSGWKIKMTKAFAPTLWWFATEFTIISLWLQNYGQVW